MDRQGPVSMRIKRKSRKKELLSFHGKRGHGESQRCPTKKVVTTSKKGEAGSPKNGAKKRVEKGGEKKKNGKERGPGLNTRKKV